MVVKDPVFGRNIRKHQLLIAMGMLALAIPFIPTLLIIIFIFALFAVLLLLSSGNRLFDMIATPLEQKSGVLDGPLRLCIALLILAMCSAFLGFPLHLFAATLGIVTI